MRKVTLIVSMAALLVVSGPALAELQNIEVGGEIQIRGNYIRDTFTGPAPMEVRWAPPLLGKRPIGGPFANLGVVSITDWDDRGSNLKMVEHRTRLNVKADFTDDVSAFIELDSYDWWGEDFRSNYITGADTRANTVDDVEVFQAYIEANEMYGYPLRLRVGRQELCLGSEWLVGNNDFALLFSGLSFDGLRLTYATDVVSLDAWWSKLAENSPLEEDGDIDFYGVYGSYLGIEDMTIDGYWLYLRDPGRIPTGFGPVGTWLGLNDFDTTQLHTLGLRAAGLAGAFDYEAEIAYQLGEADRIGSTFVGSMGLADDNADFDNWGGHFDVGYTFDASYQPRVFVGGAYFEGEDNRDISFLEWINPFYRGEASISFNRLFSDTIYSGAMDATRTFSNGYIARAGLNLRPTEKLGALLMATYFATDEAFESPRRILGIPVFPAVWTKDNDDYLGTDVCLFLTYNYSENLAFEAGWAHFFTGDGTEEGNFNFWNGLMFNGGTENDDADYWYAGTRIKF